MKKTRFESLGVYFPKKKLSTKDLISKMTHKPSFDLEKITGIKTRRIRSKNEDSYSLALQAAKNCLKKSQYKASDLDVIINCSMMRFKDKTNFFFEPPLSLFLKKELKSFKAINFDISNACVGMFNGIYILDSLIRKGVVKNGMIVSGECITPAAENAAREIKNPFDKQVASLTLGDAAAALILDKSLDKDEGIDLIDCGTDAKFVNSGIAKPNSSGTGFALYANSDEMIKARKKISIALDSFFFRNKKIFHPEKYDFILVHQITEKIVNSFIEGISNYYKKKMPKTLLSVNNFGNTVSTTHFVILYNGLKQKKIPLNSNLIMLAFGSGIGMGGISVKIKNLKF